MRGHRGVMRRARACGCEQAPARGEDPANSGRGRPLRACKRLLQFCCFLCAQHCLLSSTAQPITHRVSPAHASRIVEELGNMIKQLSLPELQALCAGRPDLILLDALTEKYFRDWHLPGAIHLPHVRVSELAPAL